MLRARTRAPWRLGAPLLAAVLLSTSAASQTPGSGSVTVVKPMKLTRVSGLSFGKLQTDNGHGVGRVTVRAAPPAERTAVNAHLIPGSTFGPSVTTIQGEPGRLYRVTLPAPTTATPGNLAVGAFTLWSKVRGDVTASGIGQIGPDGTDTLRIGATLTVPPKTKPQTFSAETPVTVAYE